MPEIWLQYGRVEVPLDIKAENLTRVVEFKEFSLVEPDWSQVPKIDQETLVVVCELTPSTEKALTAFLDRQKQIGGMLNLAKVVSSRRNLSSLRRLLSAYELAPSQFSQEFSELGAADSVQVKAPKEFTAYKKKIVISQVGFDPMFGFTGGAVSLLKCLNEALVGEAFARRSSDEPVSGAETSTSKFASQVADLVEGVFSLETLALEKGLMSLYFGDCRWAHQIACQTLRQVRTETLRSRPAAIAVSPGGRPYDDTLASSLTALFNVSGCVSERGAAILLAECGGGLGCEALWLNALGRLNLASFLGRRDYVEGLELAMFLESAKEHFSLTLVSTLPKFYVEKLGFTPAMKSSDAVSSVLSRHGSRTHIMVVPKAFDTFMESRRQE